MKPVIPPRTENPFQGMFQALNETDGNEITKCLRSIRFVFKGMRP